MTASFKSLDDWLPWLETLSPREIVLGLERVAAILGILDLPRPRVVINVAGTNGKGSSVAMLEALLRQQGMSTGCYTSPHLSRYNERIRINGVPATDDAVMEALAAVDAARDDVPLTFFEFGTLAALVAFAEADLDAWILAVGMGGRLDAVNAVEPDACLITNVALDHCAWLGDDVESIAREKAGVMRADTPVIFGSRDVPAAIHESAQNLAADLRLTGRDFGFDTAATGHWSWQGKLRTLKRLALPSLPGEWQIQNAAAVLALLESIGLLDGLDEAGASAALAAVELPGRFQVIDERYILDVAHNPAAASVLAAELSVLRIPGKLTGIIGMLADKDVDGYIDALASVVDDWIAVDVDGTRAQPADRIASPIANRTGRPCLIGGPVAEAIQFASGRADAGDYILVTGSFFVVGPALDWLADN